MTTRTRAQVASILEHRGSAGALITIPAGADHHVRNPGGTPLFFLTVYAPPEY